MNEEQREVWDEDTSGSNCRAGRRLTALDQVNYYTSKFFLFFFFEERKKKKLE